ncbi:MAG: patatin [Gemmatimonadales bacterium]
MPRTLLWRVLVLIAAATVLSGIIQMLRPAFVLGFVGAEATPAGSHFFGIVGMFMLLFGGAMLHALLSAVPQPIVLLWAALQKLGAALAVGLGVHHAIFSSTALLVAGFDLASGVLAFWYWSHLPRSQA